MAKMVDRVMEAMKNAKNIRNIAIAAHIDHGKTTFSDNLLAGAGMMSEELAGKARNLDFHDDEAERGITIDSAAVSMVHSVKGEEFLINLIDTPGHVDFGGDVTRAMRAVDGCIVLSCAVEGIMPQTETVLRQALRERVKPILFINKVDRLIKELQLTPEKMQERFVKVITEVNKLIGQIAEEDFGDRFKVNVADGSVMFGSAFHNWALSIPYMQEKQITFKDIITAYDDDSWKELKHKAPIHEVVLNSVVKHHPDPKVAQEYRIPKIWHGDKESKLGQSLIACDPKGPLAFVITKVTIDPQAGEIAAGRLFSGTMKKGESVYLNKAKQNVRTQQVYIYNGAKREIVHDVPAGNIIGVGGLKNAYPGETVTLEPDDPFEAITHLFDPVITKAIEAKKPSDLPKLIDVLVQVSKEDPSIKVEINQETGEHLMHGMGELHLEIIENRIIKEKGVEIKTSPPIVVFREAILGASPEPAEGKSPNKHNKLYFKVEPLKESVHQAIRKGELSDGRIKKKDNEIWEKLQKAGYETKESRNVRDIYNGNVLIDGTRGIVHIGEIIEMVMDMFEDVMENGPLAREPCIKVQVTLDDVKLHEDAIHRGPAQLYPAVREGIRAAMMTARPTLFEPLQVLEFDAPVEYMGEISKLISNKRGQLLDMQQEGASVSVQGKLPVAEMFGLSGDLRGATGGRGSSSLIDQTFELMPMELQHKTIRMIRERKGLKTDDQSN
ncbi:MAG: elongation factor EF-2 [Candidatus Woesearchaeota archaeon]|nr:MAG: elongation factor EF-2 [Candidatus Woesearchaeota archaeon]